MTTRALAFEDQYRKRGRRISFVVHALILLIMIFLTLPFDKKKNIDTQYAVTIAFQNSVSSNSKPLKAAAGQQRPKTEEVKKIENKPAPALKKPEEKAPEIKQTNIPKPTEPIVSEDLEEESVVVAVQEEIPVEEPEPETIPDPEPVDIPTSEPTIEAEESPSLEDVLAEIEDEAPVSTDGIPTDNEESTLEESGYPQTDNTSNESGSGTDEKGDGSGDGEQGEDADDGIGIEDSGDGEYDDSGNGIFGRKVVYRNYDMVKNASGKSGKIAFKVCINRKGTVTYVELNELVTSVTDRRIIRDAMNAMWDYRYEPDLGAPREECGKFTVIIDNFRGIKPIN